MDNLLLGFKSKKERDDFFIALLVLFLFGWLIYFVGGFRTDRINLDPSDLSLTPAVVTDSINVALPDFDGDGVADKYDACPEVAGVINNDGCPSDTDGDGISDLNDECPELKGDIKTNGCPPDTDGDGIYDTNDACPSIAGIAKNSGCPADTDGDGVYDKDDLCPNKVGLATNNGCPSIKLSEEEKESISVAVQAVGFKGGSAELVTDRKYKTIESLNSIAAILKKYPKYKLDITGHTSSEGDDSKNMQLSIDRAKTCYDYLVNQGIDARRLTYDGKGETQRIILNDDTKDKRAENRRVEFNLHY